MRLAALALLLVAGCGTGTPLPPATPSTSCDFRMLDHNRRACEGGDFLEPAPGSASCGVCIRAVPMPSNR